MYVQFVIKSTNLFIIFLGIIYLFQLCFLSSFRYNHFFITIFHIITIHFYNIFVNHHFHFLFFSFKLYVQIYFSDIFISYFTSAKDNFKRHVQM